MNNREWTIMIYMAGDNNLSVDMAYAMEQIKGVATAGDEGPNLFVYYDGNSPAIPTMYCDFTDPLKPKYVRSYKVPDKLYPVPAKHNENAADWKAVVNFVDWCVNKVEVEDGGEITYGRRANRYALIFSGHSLGFQDIGLFKDESSGKSMKMDDLNSVLTRLVSDKKTLEQAARHYKVPKGGERDRLTTVLLGQRLDILGFDSCVMGMLEVGYQFQTVAETMIASEGSVPSAGWTYAKILGCLARGHDGRYGDTRRVAEYFVRQFIESQDAYTVGGVSVDMAAWDLSEMGGLADEFDNLSGALVECFRHEDSGISMIMERAVLLAHWKCQSYMYDQNIDLGDFCELLDRECALFAAALEGDELELLQYVRGQCWNVWQQLRKAVILSGFSGGLYQYSNGVSVFFPWSREGYEVSRKNYESLLFAKDVKRKKFYWAGFLKKYLYEVALRKFEPTTPDAPHGEKYRYTSGIRFEEAAATMVYADQEGSKLAGLEGSKLAGLEGSKLAGLEGSKLAGLEGSKLAGLEGSKLAGLEGSKLAGLEGSKLAGLEGSKLAGLEGSKLAGLEGSKLGGGGSNAFFDSLRLFKNIEARWNISGFTKRPGEAKYGDG
jgi:hypothetical protein